MGEVIFALDIGTRKIAGLLMEKTSDGYCIHHTVIKEQLPNAMQDGQIHNIPKVAEIIKQVATEICDYAGKPLTSVAVAAAGRSLRTKHGQATLRLIPDTEISAATLQELELSAVHDALSHMNQYQVETAIDTYLCVGYSVIQSYLDDQPIQNLIGHQGYSASLEIIATFLPRIVIDALTTALRLAELDMLSLTLEPIAAMHTIIPSSMRMLNIALVDVGAGTSDIAIASSGTIKAYGMIAEAGDLITKSIANNYLLDFMEAERVKRTLASNSSITCFDVLGNQIQLETDEVLALIKPDVSNLGEQISTEILALNEGTPKGVILIGGGSLTPQLSTEISRYLQLPPHLIRVRERANLTNISGAEDYLGPQLITPICIGCNHLDTKSMQFLKVNINGEAIQFLRVKEATIGDALIHSGYNIENLIKNTSPAINIKVNQENRVIKCSKSKPVQITCNDLPATLQTKLKDDDQIIIHSNLDQKNNITLLDLIGELNLTTKLMINGKNITVQPQFYLNDKHISSNHPLKDGDEITYQPINNVVRALAAANIEYQPSSITIMVNQQSVTLEAPAPIMINGKAATWNQAIKDGDRIEYQTDRDVRFILADIFRVYQPERLDEIKQAEFFINGNKAGYTEQLKDKDQIVVKYQ